MDIFDIGLLPSALKAPPSRPEDGRKITVWADVDQSKPVCARAPDRRVTTYWPVSGSLEGQRSVIEAVINGSRMNSRYAVWQERPMLCCCGVTDGGKTAHPYAPGHCKEGSAFQSRQS